MGGTFTDLVVDDGSGALPLYKAPTTPAHPVDGVLAAVDVAAAARGGGRAELLGEAEVFIHATTRALNAVLTGATARTALLLTAGHPDVLLFREGGRADPFDLTVPYPRPFVPRALTFEVPERVLADGTLRRPLDEAAVAAVAAELAAAGVEAVAVCLLWSIVAPAHELRVGEILAERLPGVPVTLSHRLNPTLREYRRASSTAIDAALKPVMSGYVGELDERLRAEGFGGELLLVSSTGGTLHPGPAAAAPIHLLGSGPAMAPVAARGVVAEAATEVPAGAEATAIVVDVGGTSCDVSLVREGTILTTRESWIGPPDRGHITGFASVDVRSIAAGGGSVAWVDDGGLLRVGPRSAGAEPGPACYGRGGEEPTVTDAALALGFIDPEYFLGGTMEVDKALAERAIQNKVAEPVGWTMTEAAAAIWSIVVQSMSAAVRAVSIEKGHDPREFTFVQYGGAGALFSAPIARSLGISRVIVPSSASTFSASGLMHADARRSLVRTINWNVLREPPDRAREAFEALSAEARKELLADGFEEDAIEVVLEGDLKFIGQAFEVTMPIDLGKLESQAVYDRFVATYEAMYGEGTAWEGFDVMLLNCRVTGVGRTVKPELERLATREGDVAAARKSSRTVFMPDAGHDVEMHVYADDRLFPGARLQGPAIVEVRDTTIYVPVDAELRVDEFGNYVMEV